MNIAEIKIKILPVLKKAGVKHSALFGSYARKEANERSDVDLLVEMQPSSTLFDFIGLKQDLELVLKKKVDLLTFDSVNPKLRKIIQKDSISIL